jgi:hypothetical protein
MKIGERTLLDINISNMKTVCDEVYVVTSKDNTKWFTQGYNELIINSGMGCGDAVMRALSLLDLDKNDTVFIQWGDSLCEVSLLELLENSYTDKWIIPCAYEESPYVQIIGTETGVQVHFSKYGEDVSAGYHDLSLFYGNASAMLDSLTDLHHKYFKDGQYVHPHGNELTFLDVFNETDLPVSLLPTIFSSFSFNTVQEFTKLYEVDVP